MLARYVFLFCFFFNDTATTEIYPLSLHDAFPICTPGTPGRRSRAFNQEKLQLDRRVALPRSEEHTSELQSPCNVVCRLLLGSEEHTSELQSPCNLVCRLLLEKKQNSAAPTARPPRLSESLPTPRAAAAHVAVQRDYCPAPVVFGRCGIRSLFFFFFFNDTATTEIYTLSLHDALPISEGSASVTARREKRRERVMR